MCVCHCFSNGHHGLWYHVISQLSQILNQHKGDMFSAIFHLTLSKLVWIHTSRLSQFNLDWNWETTAGWQLVNSTYKLNNGKCAHWVLDSVSRSDALSPTCTMMPWAGIRIATIQLRMRVLKRLTKTTYLVNDRADSKPGYVWFQTSCLSWYSSMPRNYLFSVRIEN